MSLFFLGDVIFGSWRAEDGLGDLGSWSDWTSWGKGDLKSRTETS
ncbi:MULTISPECIES: hypothetical protein [unclassified Lentimicrobium]|nr:MULTISPECIES: hypothetical protein [unclassified Lentimicrobium]